MPMICTSSKFFVLLSPEFVFLSFHRCLETNSERLQKWLPPRVTSFPSTSGMGLFSTTCRNYFLKNTLITATTNPALRIFLVNISTFFLVSANMMVLFSSWFPISSSKSINLISNFVLNTMNFFFPTYEAHFKSNRTDFFLCQEIQTIQCGV